MDTSSNSTAPLDSSSQYGPAPALVPCLIPYNPNGRLNVPAQLLFPVGRLMGQYSFASVVDAAPNASNWALQQLPNPVISPSQALFSPGRLPDLALCAINARGFHDNRTPTVAAEAPATIPHHNSRNVPVNQHASMIVRGSVASSPHPALKSHPILLAQAADVERLSGLQVLLRLQIEAFMATAAHVETHKQGRTKPVRIGQVGIRCRHCAYMPLVVHATGSTYFPTTTQGFYQAAQNMRMMHLQSGKCLAMPDAVKAQFGAVLAFKGPIVSGAGRAYWTKSARGMSLVDTDQGIFLKGYIPSDARVINDSAVYQAVTPSKKRMVKHENAQHATMWSSSKKFKKYR